MRKLKEMKKNNKGFSLVELIVVIAIMVVLVAVLGSTILGYVERSKYGKDVQALDSVKTAISTFVSDPDCNYTNSQPYTLADLLGNDDEDQPRDPNGVIRATLQEVFSFPADDAEDDTIRFNAASNAFRGITAGDVQVTIVNGAVSILVPINGEEAGNYDAYIAGTQYAGQEDATKAE